MCEMGECAPPSGQEWSSLNDSKPCTWSPSHLSDLSTFRGVSLKEAPPGHHQLTNSTPTKIFLNPIIFIFTDTMWAMRFPVWTSERRICVSDSSFLLICSFVRAGEPKGTAWERSVNAAQLPQSGACFSLCIQQAATVLRMIHHLHDLLHVFLLWSVCYERVMVINPSCFIL